jgi:hypothetical protein
MIEATTVKLSGDLLAIEYEGNSWKGSSGRVDVKIVFGELNKLIASGACIVESSDVITGNNLGFEISGASKATLEIEADKLDTEVSGASAIRLMGSVSEQLVNVSGASSYRAGDLISKEADIDGSGASNATIHVSGKLKADLSGASSAYYYGDPKIVDVNSSGASSVKKRN